MQIKTNIFKEQEEPSRYKSVFDTILTPINATAKETDEAFSNAIDVIFDKKNNKNKSFICTHNTNDITKMIELYTKNHELYNYNTYHASLYGFIERDTQRIVESGIKTFKYLPYGEMDDAVPYLMRRIYENPKVLYYFFK
jgi:proline dehydrogenase